jgi:hypothetical protein
MSTFNNSDNETTMVGPHHLPGKRNRLPSPCPDCNEHWGSIYISKFTKKPGLSFKEITDANKNVIKTIPVKSTPRPKPRITEAYEECLRLVEMINVWFEPDIDLIGLIQSRYPEFIDTNLQFFARGMRTYRKFFEPSLDLKWTKSWGAWLKIEQDRMDYGAHAAASKNYTQTNVCAVCKKKDQTELMRCTLESPSGWSCPRCGSTKGLRVSMTAKQVKDKSEAVQRMAWLISSDMPPFRDFLFEVKHMLASDLVLRNEYLKRLEVYNKKERYVKINEEMISSSLSLFEKNKPKQVRPKSMKTIAREETLLVVGVTSKFAERLKEFPPEIEQDIASGMRETCRLFDPLVDIDKANDSQPKTLIDSPLQPAKIEMKKGLPYAYWYIKHGRKKKCGPFKMWQMSPEYHKVIVDRKKKKEMI